MTRSEYVQMEYAYLRTWGLKDAEIAERLGLQLKSLQRAIRRARLAESDFISSR